MDGVEATSPDYSVRGEKALVQLARKALGHDLLDRAVHAPICLFPQPLLGELV